MVSNVFVLNLYCFAILLVIQTKYWQNYLLRIKSLYTPLGYIEILSCNNYAAHSDQLSAKEKKMQTNTKISTNKTKYFFIFSLVFFALGFFNIIFGWLGFICMVLPFVLLAKDQKKTWCQNYCPRANLFNVLFKNRSFLGKIGPDWIIKGKGKWVILGYFSINLFVLTM